MLRTKQPLRVQFPAGATGSSIPHSVQTGSGTHTTSCPVRTEGSSPEGGDGHSSPSGEEIKNAWSYTSTIHVFL